jgi:hypothetical protein
MSLVLIQNGRTYVRDGAWEVTQATYPAGLVGWPAVRLALLGASYTVTSAQDALGQRFFDDINGLPNPNYATFDLVTTQTLRAFYGFIGGTAAAHRFNWLNPYDADSAFRLNWFGGWVHNSLGAQANGKDTRANTHLDPRRILTGGKAQNDSFGFYTSTKTEPKDLSPMGFDVAQYFYRMRINNGDGTAWALIGDINTISSGPTPDTSGLWMAQRFNGVTTLRRNGAQISGNKASTLDFPPPVSPTDTCLFNCVYISEAFTEAQAVAFYNAVRALMTGLGRWV